MYAVPEFLCEETFHEFSQMSTEKFHNRGKIRLQKNLMVIV